jgi:hypothetical protein
MAVHVKIISHSLFDDVLRVTFVGDMVSIDGLEAGSFGFISFVVFRLVIAYAISRVSIIFPKLPLVDIAPHTAHLSVAKLCFDIWNNELPRRDPRYRQINQQSTYQSQRPILGRLSRTNFPIEDISADV